VSGREPQLLGAVLLLCLAMFVAERRAAADDDPPPQAKQEAIVLFRNVVERKTAEPGRCYLADSWLNYPIPEAVARQHLRLAIHADLVPIDHQTQPREVIDPDNVMRAAFCDEAEAKRQRDALVESFKRGTFKIEKGPFDVHPRLAVRRSEYSFPIFDASYGRAVIVSTLTSYDWVKISDDEVRPLGLTAGGVAEVYDKRDGAWHRVASELLFAAH
jgi:hypothetical protein